MMTSPERIAVMFRAVTPGGAAWVALADTRRELYDQLLEEAAGACPDDATDEQRRAAFARAVASLPAAVVVRTIAASNVALSVLTGHALTDHRQRLLTRDDQRDGFELAGLLLGALNKVADELERNDGAGDEDTRYRAALASLNRQHVTARVEAFKKPCADTHPHAQVPRGVYALVLGLVDELDHAKANRPAIVITVASELLTVWNGPTTLPLGPAPGARAVIDPALLEALWSSAEKQNAGLARLDSVHLVRGIEWLARVTGELHARHGQSAPSHITVAGGWREIAKLIGSSAECYDDVRDAMRAQSTVRVTVGSVTGNLFALAERRASPGRPAEVTFTPGAMLLPGFVHDEKLERRERRLVPVLGPNRPLIGDRATHGAQARFQWGLLLFLRERAHELVGETGGVLITAEDFNGVARNHAPSLVRGAKWKPVLEALIAGTDSAPPMLKRVAPDRYTLSDAHELERAFLEEAGRRSTTGAAKGRARMAKKANARAKVERR